MARFRTVASLGLVFVFVFFLGLPATGEAQWYSRNNPIDSSQLTGVPWGFRSFWLQPWRSSLTTRPATALQDAIGINMDNQISGREAPDLARLLHDSGFRRARVEFPWDGMSYADPSQVADPSWWGSDITAMRDNGIRPLILLDPPQGGPTPLKAFNLTLTAPAAVGATTVSLSAASAAQAVSGLTGINAQGIAAGVLITSVDGNGVATLSRPLPMSLTAGTVAATTLRYPPFALPYLADGTTPNPAFEQTMSGWLAYVKAACQFVRNTYGSDNFDVEIFNEGTAFLSNANYYSSVPAPNTQQLGQLENAILQGTIQMLRDPANGLTGVKVGDGFSNQVPWVSGASVPSGTDAIDKHPYASSLSFPQSTVDNPGVRPVDALGNFSERYLGNGAWGDLFVPSFRVFMPEFWLTGIATETLMRDLSPIQTSISGTPHGAGTHPPGSPPPRMWITEDNLDANQAQANGLPAVDLPEMQAKAALRYYVAYASEGVQAIDLFAAKGGSCCELIPWSFFEAVDANPTSYPGDAAGGLTMQAVGRMTATLAGAENTSATRQLTLESIASENNNDVQFVGDGTAAHPPLYNRDMLAFFPFQVSQNKFVAPVYVMSTDLTHYYTANPAPGYTSYDMPPEQFRLTIGNVNAANASVSLTDPLTGQDEPATIVSRDGSDIVVQLAATDSPRMLTIVDAPKTPGTTVTTTTVITPVAPGPTTHSQPSSTRSTTVGHSSKGLVLKAPDRITVKNAERQGIRLGVGCKRSCVVTVTAVPAGVRHAQVVAEVTAHVAAGKIAQLVLRMTATGRHWLRKLHTATRLRITARTSGGSVSKAVGISKPGIHKRKRRPRRSARETPVVITRRRPRA